VVGDEALVGILGEVAALEARMLAVVEKKLAIQRYQKMLDMGQAEPFAAAEEARVHLGHVGRLWRSLAAWQANVRHWQGSAFEAIDVESILEESALHSKTVLVCERNLPAGSTAVQHLKRLVFDFQETMPIVVALGNKHLKDVHWQEIKAVSGTTAFPLEAKRFTLGELVDLGVAHWADEIVNISVTATQEFNLQTQLDQLTQTWAKLNFDVVRHGDKDAYKLTGLDQVQLVLDESMQSASLIAGSRYAKRLQTQAEETVDRLNLISDTLEQWRECQRNWLYLENIFSSPDICKQRPKDFQDYEAVNKAWSKLMKVVAGGKRNVRTQCSANGTQRYTELLLWNRTMDRVQKNLEDYLEEKRGQFPRFYFISNDELLQILAHAADLRAVEKHASKCFENLQSFVLQEEIAVEREAALEARRRRELERQRLQAEAEALVAAQAATLGSHDSGATAGLTPAPRGREPGPTPGQALATPHDEEDVLEDEQFEASDANDVFGIKSSQGEKLRFTRLLKIRGQGVEGWMKLLEEYMVIALQKAVRVAYSRYYDDLAEENGRKVWVLKHLAQAVAVVDLITWTEGTEAALADLLDENPFAMEDHLLLMKEQLTELTELIRGSLAPVQRASLVALITQDVHCRDIVAKLHSSNV
jgi:hypothetical protein